MPELRSPPHNSNHAAAVVLATAMRETRTFLPAAIASSRTPAGAANPLDAGAGVGTEAVGAGDVADVAGLEDGVVAGVVAWPAGVSVRAGDGITGWVLPGRGDKAGTVDGVTAGTEAAGPGVTAGAGTGRTRT